MVRHLLFVLICVFALAAISSADNLGDISKKEKARRDAIAKSGKKPKVFTNADIEKLKAQLAMQESSGKSQEGTTGEQPGTTTEAPATEGQPAEGQDQMEETPVTEPIAEEPQQNDSNKPSKETQLKALKEQKEDLEKQAEDAEKNIGAGGYYHSRDVGGNAEKISDAQKKLDEVNKKIEDLENQPDDQSNNQQQPEEEQP